VYTWAYPVECIAFQVKEAIGYAQYVPNGGGLAAVAAFAQDVVQLAPDHAKVAFENDRARVLHRIQTT
jgi:hypothetical protein